MRTRDKLAAELRKVAAHASPENADKYEHFAVRALTGEFDDFADTYDCPITQLHNELIAAGFTKFAARVRDGEFDATKEESEAWANSPEGRAAMENLASDTAFPPTPTLGDGPVQEEYVNPMNVMAGIIDEFFNGPPNTPDKLRVSKKVGFVLLVFPFDDVTGRCNYISNANRDDVVTMLKEQIKYFEGQAQVKGRA